MVDIFQPSTWEHYNYNTRTLPTTHVGGDCHWEKLHSAGTRKREGGVYEVGVGVECGVT